MLVTKTGGAQQRLADALADGGGGLAFQPFLGQTDLLWDKPAASVFDTWLNQQGNAAFGLGSGNGFGVVDPGSDYVPNDTVTVAGGTFIDPAIITITQTGAASAAVVSPGSGGIPGKAYVQGTTGTSGTPFTLQITIASDGTLASVDNVLNPGAYTVNPADLSNEPVADISGSGLIGAAVSVVMGAYSGSVTHQGAYTVNPPRPTGQSATSGAGTGATWMLFSNDTPAILTDGNSSGHPITLSVVSNGLPNGQCLTAALRPLGSAPWTVTVGAALVASSADSNGYVVPIVLYNSIQDQAVVILWKVDGNISYVDYPQASVPIVGNYFANTQGSAKVPPEYFMWFRMVNDGIYIIAYFSLENIKYIEFSRVLATSFGTPFDKIGFGIDRAENAAGESLIAIWNWTLTSP